MILYTHYSFSLSKQLGELRKAGKKSERAADKCEAIISDIQQYGCQCESVTSKRTRNGELRIKNCVKYNLGAGYRLITIRVDHHLFFCFVGSHDDTNQWIEHHRYDDLRPGDSSYRCEERILQAYALKPNTCEVATEDDIEDCYETELMARLDESHLKAIFKGLFMAPVSETDTTGNHQAVTA